MLGLLNTNAWITRDEAIYNFTQARIKAVVVYFHVLRPYFIEEIENAGLHSRSSSEKAQSPRPPFNTNISDYWEMRLMLEKTRTVCSEIRFSSKK